MKQAVACHREALAGGGVGGERQVGFLGGTAVRGGAAVCDDGGKLGVSRVGGFHALHPEVEGAPRLTVFASKMLMSHRNTEVQIALYTKPERPWSLTFSHHAIVGASCGKSHSRTPRAPPRSLSSR